MRRLLGFILVFGLTACGAAFAEDASLPYRTWLQKDAEAYLAQAQKRAAGLPDPVLKRELKGMSSLLSDLKRKRDVESLQSWGDKFFRLADAANQHRSLSGLADLERRMKGDFQSLLADYQETGPAPAALARTQPTQSGKSQAALQRLAGRLASRSNDPAATLNSFYSRDNAGGSAPVQGQAARRATASFSPASKKGASFAYVPLPVASAPAPETGKLGHALSQAFSEGSTPSAVSESLVVAYFKNKAAARVAAEYRVDGYGQVVGVRLASLDYSETRTFDGGLLRGRTVEHAGVRAEFAYAYDAKGRPVRRTVSSSGPQGPLGGAAVDLDPKTARPVRAVAYDAQGNAERLKPSKARALAEALFAPAAAAASAVAPLLDWQLDADKRLSFVSDERTRQYHDPFWYRYLPRVSRGWTDRNDPSTWTVHPVLGVRRPHDGVDMPMAEGTAVYAARRGKVVSVGWEGGYGQRIVIQHYLGNRPDGARQGQTIYGHLSSILVRRGQWVIPGDQIIGRVGSTGISTGPHLHFEIREGDHAVDPLTKLSPALPNPSGRTLLDSRVAQNLQDNN